MKTVKILSLALAFLLATAVFTLAAVGFIALAIDDAKLRPSSSADIASWVQAIAAAFAILASAALALHIQSRDYRLRQQASGEIARVIAFTAETMLAATRDSFDTRQKIYDVSVGKSTFDFSAIEDLWDLVSKFDLQSLHAPELAKHMLMLRLGIRKVKNHMNDLCTVNAVMTSADFDLLFQTLKDEAEMARYVHAKIKAGYSHVPTPPSSMRQSSEGLPMAPSTNV